MIHVRQIITTSVISSVQIKEIKTSKTYQCSHEQESWDANSGNTITLPDL